MNCFNHPSEIAVGTCNDCNKGLCQECATRYEFPICVNCNQQRIKYEKKEIIKGFLIILGVGFILSLLMKSFMTNYSQIRGLPLFIHYACFASVAGWRFLNRITPSFFLALPLFGWLLYFGLKTILSYIIGIFVFPYVIYRDVKRWLELNKIT